MEIGPYISNEPATPDYVLAVFQDLHRHSSQCDPGVNSKAAISMATTVHDWRESCDLLGWRALGQAYNEYFGMNGSEEEWHAVLEPARQRNLRHVCEFIANCASRQRVRPAGLFGKTCIPAGAFLAMRRLLGDAGEDIREISPSTPLDEYTRRHRRLFLEHSILWAPGSLPPVRIVRREYDRAECGLLIGIGLTFVGLIASAMTGSFLFALPGLFLLFLSYVAIDAAAKALPDSVQFGELITFRDWAVAIARGRT